MTLSNSAAFADDYAIAKSKLDAIKTEVEELREKILETKMDQIDGLLFSVFVSDVKGRKTINKEAVIKLLLDLGATEEQVNGCFTQGENTKQLRIKASVKAAA